MQEESYRIIDFISQSDLKLFDKDIRRFYQERVLGIKEKETIMPDYFLIGSLVDSILLTPGLTNKNFHICSDTKASEIIRDIITCAYNENIGCSIITDHIMGTSILRLAREKLYQPNYKDQTIIDKVIEKGKEYFDNLIIAGSTGKVLVPFDINILARRIVNNFKKDDFIKQHLVVSDESCEEIKVQVVLTGKFNDIEVKGMIDLMKIDHKNKIIYPKDIKTSKSIEGFFKSYRDLRYDIQGSFYSALLRQNYPDYTIYPFEFIVGSTTTTEPPEVFTMSEEDIYGAQYGGTNTYGGYTRGWESILEDYKWHMIDGRWDHKKSYYINKTNKLKMFS